MENSKDTKQLEDAAGLEEALRLLSEMKQVDKEKGWKRVLSDLSDSGERKQKILHVRYFWAAAALILLLLTVGITGLWPSSEKDKLSGMASLAGAQPRLILDDGRPVPLGEAHDFQGIAGMQGVIIDKEKHTLEYVYCVPAAEENIKYNTLEIPRGMEFKLILADGTRVWLNADSRLRYPVSFHGLERRVYLDGEAYFEVAKDNVRPFRVESVAQTIEVLGTHFNVCAYKDEPRVYTTLAEGSVAVTCGVSGESLVLKPGEEATVDVAGGHISVAKVNAKQVISWKDGLFVFDEQDLETILSKVARWYDVEIFYANNAARGLVFKGDLPRYEKLPDLLKVLESSSDVRFSLDGRSLVVK